MKSAKERAAGSERARVQGNEREVEIAKGQIAALDPYLDKAEVKGERRVPNIAEKLYPLAVQMLRDEGYTVEDHRIPCYPEGFQWSWTIAW